MIRAPWWRKPQWLLLAIMFHATTAHAQPAVRACDAAAVYKDSPELHGDAVQRMHPLVSRGRYAQLAAEHQWTAIDSILRDEALAAFASAGVDPASAVRFDREMSDLLALLTRLPAESDPRRGRFVSDSLRTNRFAPIHGIDPGDYRLFDTDAIDVGRLGERQTQAFCWSALSMDEVLFRINRPLEAVAIARLGRLTGSWTNYRTYGYTRQPLELLLFRGSARDTLPPATQWLVGHLSLGADIHGSSADSLVSSSTTVVELIGVLFNRKDFTQYHGASFIAAVGEDHPIGYGALVHFARSMRAGVLYHPGFTGSKWTVVTSTDLYGLLEHSKKSIDEGLAMARGIVILPSHDR